MRVSTIAAMDKNRVVGFEGALPWHLPGDLQYFKKITLGKPVVMGRKTYDSMGKPLPGRRNIVISRQEGLVIEGCEVVSSLLEALSLVDEPRVEQCDEVPEVMVIGGGEIFEQALPIAQRQYLTMIDYEFEGDAYYPVWDQLEWKMISRDFIQADDNDIYSRWNLILERV